MKFFPKRETKKGPLLQKDDIKNLSSLISKLQSGDQLSNYFLSNISKSTREQLNISIDESTKEALVKDLNELLQTQGLYNLLMQVTETNQKPIVENPQGEDLIYLNRELLAIAYPDEIAMPSEFRLQRQPVFNQDGGEIPEQLEELQSQYDKISERLTKLEGTVESIKLANINQTLLTGINAWNSTVQEMRTVVSEVSQIKPSLDELNKNLPQIPDDIVEVIESKVIPELATIILSKVKETAKEERKLREKLEAQVKEMTAALTEAENQVEETAEEERKLREKLEAQVKEMTAALTEAENQAEVKRKSLECCLKKEQKARKAAEGSLAEAKQQELELREQALVGPVSKPQTPEIDSTIEVDEAWSPFLEFIKQHFRDASLVEQDIKLALSENQDPATVYKCFERFARVTGIIYRISIQQPESVDFGDFVHRFQEQLQLRIYGLDAEGNQWKSLSPRPKKVLLGEKLEPESPQREIYDKKLNKMLRTGKPQAGQVIALLSPGIESTYRPEWNILPEVAVYGENK